MKHLTEKWRGSIEQAGRFVELKHRLDAGRVFLTLFLVICMVSRGALVASSDNFINRLNYGVKFQRQSVVRPTTAIWLHTIGIPLPIQVFSAQFELRDRSTLLSNGTMVGRRNECVHTALEPGPHVRMPLCHKYLQNVEFLVKVAKDGHNTLHQLIQDIRTLIPESRSKQEGSRKRSIIPVIGDILHGLFGTATQTDLDTINQHVIQMAESFRQQQKVIKKSATDLSSFITTSTTRIDQLVERVKENAIEGVRMVEGAITNFEVQMKYVNTLYLHTMELEHSISQLETHYVSYLNSLETLVSGFLPVYLISKDIMSQTLTSISNSLSQSNNVYHLIHTQSSWYYRRATFIMKRDEANIYVTIQFPLSSFNSDFSVYRIHTFPLTTHENNSEHVTQINDLPAGFAIDSEQNYFYTLSDAQLRGMATHEHSNVQKVFNVVNDKSCIIALFRNDGNLIKQTCKFSIMMHSLEPGLTYLQDSTFLLTRIDQYLLTCNRTKTTMMGCKLCLVNLKANCSISTEKQYVPPSYMQINSNTTSTKHLTNLAVLLNFFGNDTLQLIQGDTLLYEEAQISLPPLRFFEHKINEKVAQDRKLKIDLMKASEAIKTDGIILNGLSEAIVTGEVKTGEAFWTSIPGFVSEINSAIILLLIFNVCYLLFRVRKLSITVMVLQTNALKTHADQPLVFNYFKSIDSLTNTSSIADSSSALHTIIIQTTERLWPYLLVCFIGVTLMLFTGYKIWKHTCKQSEINIKFSMMLEINSNQRSVFVKILDLFGQPQDFRVTAEDFIRDLKVEGCILPKLKFIWETVCLTDQVTGEEFRIKLSHPLTWKQASTLRQKLSRPFVVLPVFVKDNQLTRINVINLAAPLLVREGSTRGPVIPHR